MRVHNEEKYIADALCSLESIRIPFEIVLVLHNCTDKTEEIAKTFTHLPLRIYHYHQSLSRAGFENLITPRDDPHSLASFYTWCFSKATMTFTCKWDGDFRASTNLVRFFNKKLALQAPPTCYKIPCRLSDTIVNEEYYLFNCLDESRLYNKSVFWEYPNFVQGTKYERIPHEILSIPPTVLKPYWNKKPWFEVEHDTEFQKRLITLQEIVGLEPVGSSRASNPECDAVFKRVRENEPRLAAAGIFLYK